MEYYKSVLCVTYKDLTDGDDPVVKYEALKRSISRGRVKTIQRGGGEGRVALVVWQSLSARVRERFVARYGSPDEYLKRQRMRETVVLDAEARRFYEEFRYPLNGVPTALTEELIARYTLNASVLNVLVAGLEDRTVLRRMMNNAQNTREQWDIAQRTCEALREEYEHTLPSSLARLKEAVKRYRTGGYATLVSGKVGNRSAQKISEEAGALLVALRRSKVPVLTPRQLFGRFNALAEERGWKPLRSIRAMEEYLSLPEVQPLWWDAVHGELASSQRFGRKHRTELPQLRDALWYGDGTKLNLYYRDEEGRVRTTSVYEVVDAATEVLLGYHISDTENYEQQYRAYRMAVVTAGHKPYEIVHDNQGGHKRANSAQMLDRICRVHRTTAPYNGESKTIESIFGRFQAEVLHRHWNFTGQNITARRSSSRADLEFISANRASLPTLEELKQAYAACRREWNEGVRPGTSERRIDLYERSVNPETEAVGEAEMVDLFWTMTSRAVTFTSEGLTLTVDGRRYTYEVYAAPGVPDMEWRRRNTMRAFHVAYDPADMASVRLYSVDRAGRKRFERVASTYMTVHRAMQEQTAEERAFIRQQQAAVAAERVERVAAGRRLAAREGLLPEQHGLVSPALRGVSREVQDEMSRRMARLRRGAELEPGRVTKVLSLMTDDELDGPIRLDMGRVAGKL